MEYMINFKIFNKMNDKTYLKILILIYKFIAHISNLFSDKSNHNEIYDKF
jgi:hypothetical protein